MEEGVVSSMRWPRMLAYGWGRVSPNRTNSIDKICTVRKFGNRFVRKAGRSYDDIFIPCLC